jgi:hypothetical protein
MAYDIDATGDPYIAASAVGAFMAVYFASGNPEYVHPASALHTQRSIGLTIATAATPGQPVAVKTQGAAKAVAAGSIAAGDPVAVGSINGALVKASAFAAATNAAPVRHFVGYARMNAGAGDIFTVDVCPFVSI